MTASEEIQKKVISTLFLYPAARDKYIRKLFQGCFTGMYKEAFKIIRDVHFSNAPMDFVYISEKYKNTSNISMLDFVTAVGEYANVDVSFMDWGVDYLKNTYFSKIIDNMCIKMKNSIMNGSKEDVFRYTDSIGKSYRAIYRDNVEMTDHFSEFINSLQSSNENIKTSFSKLNKVIGGWTRKDITSIGGKPGHNKTTFSVFDLTEEIQLGYVNKAIYFAVDETGDKIARRIIAKDLDVSLTELREGKVELNKEEIVSSIKRLYGDKLIIIDNAFTPDEISKIILDIMPDRVIIDHLQELDYGNEGISDTKVTVSCAKLKAVAKRANCNITLLSQVRDKLIDERFEDKIPRPHDFLYASDLRRKSRELCVVYWEYQDKQDAEEIMGIFDFIVYKSTYSPRTRIRLEINPDKARFTEIGYDKSKGIWQ
jgi:replicative DNA helicase